MVVVMAILSFAYPDAVGRHFKEDHTFELLTAAAFLGAFVVVAVQLLRRRQVTTLSLAAGLLGLLAFLDEMSFGERLFDFEAPRMFDTKIDSLHDFLLPLWTALADRDPAAMAFSAAALVVVVVVLILAVRRGVLRQEPDWPLLAGAVAFLVPGLLFDVMFENYELPVLERSYLEEHLELSAGILTLLFTWRSVRRRRSGATG